MSAYIDANISDPKRLAYWFHLGEAVSSLPPEATLKLYLEQFLKVLREYAVCMSDLDARRDSMSLGSRDSGGAVTWGVDLISKRFSASKKWFRNHGPSEDEDTFGTFASEMRQNNNVVVAPSRPRKSRPVSFIQSKMITSSLPSLSASPPPTIQEDSSHIRGASIASQATSAGGEYFVVTPLPFTLDEEVTIIGLCDSLQANYSEIDSFLQVESHPQPQGGGSSSQLSLLSSSGRTKKSPHDTYDLAIAVDQLIQKEVVGSILEIIEQQRNYSPTFGFRKKIPENKLTRSKSFTSSSSPGKGDTKGGLGKLEALYNELTKEKLNKENEKEKEKEKEKEREKGKLGKDEQEHEEDKKKDKEKVELNDD